MTPPETPQAGLSADRGDYPPAVSLRLDVLRKRAEFLAAARAAHTATPGFVLQMRVRRPDQGASDCAVLDGIRVGFTCSKKVGNAVARNRAKRRLREIARLILPTYGRPGADYVLIGRRGATATLPFEQLQADLIKALEKLHRARR